MILCVFGMGHNHIQGGEIVIIDIDFICAEYRMKSLFAAPNSDMLLDDSDSIHGHNHSRLR
jgi:hypothetical protein